MKRVEIVALYNQVELEILNNLRDSYKKSYNKLSEKDRSFEKFQTQALSDIESFKRQNTTIINKRSGKINKEINDLIKTTYKDSARREERNIIEILGEDKVKNINNPFNMNNGKLQALLIELKKTSRDSKTAILRESEDIYRKIIAKASIYKNAGYDIWTCVDKASAEFLSNGISCIKYKDGRSMNIASYSEMALRTAETRATLIGEAEARDRQGINTVEISHYSNCSELCIDWQGRIFIDDVYSNITSNNTKGYPLLSEAIAGGLFHPNCKHTAETWIEGQDKKPRKISDKRKEKMVRNSKLEQQQRYNERQIRKYKALEASATSKQYQDKYSAKVQEWTNKNVELIKDNKKVLTRDIEREKLRP